MCSYGKKEVSGLLVITTSHTRDYDYDYDETLSKLEYYTHHRHNIYIYTKEEATLHQNISETTSNYCISYCNYINWDPYCYCKIT